MNLFFCTPNFIRLTYEFGIRLTYEFGFNGNVMGAEANFTVSSSSLNTIVNHACLHLM